MADVMSVKRLSSLNGALAESKAHHVGGVPPSSFQNPWPSFRATGLHEVFFAKFIRSDKDFVPVPKNREGLVPVRKPDWGSNEDPKGEKLKATWIGHASWLIETSVSKQSVTEHSERGLRILFDPLFSERTSPVTWAGPKRYTPTPCTVHELPVVDAIVISHNHYDHLDVATIMHIYAKQKQKLTVFCPLGNSSTLLGLGINQSQVVEMDWWDVAELRVEKIGSAKLICTPAQHVSGRGIMDRNKGLWASWCLLEEYISEKYDTSLRQERVRRLFFAGDTGYRTLPKRKVSKEEAATYTHCPAFKEIGELCGPFDLALVPIGLYLPRDLMSPMHCAPEDSACIHRDIKSKRTIGMHYGTVRGGLSAQYEDVREPPKRWKEACEAEGFKWDEEVGLCDIGETVIIA